MTPEEAKKLKVGDKVRCVSVGHVWSGNDSIKIGGEYVISSFDGGDPEFKLQTSDRYPNWCLFDQYPEDFEVVSRRPTAGDKVRILPTADYEGLIPYIGKVVLIAADDADSVPYRLVLDGKFLAYAREREVELYVPETPAMARAALLEKFKDYVLQNCAPPPRARAPEGDYDQGDYDQGVQDVLYGIAESVFGIKIIDVPAVEARIEFVPVEG